MQYVFKNPSQDFNTLKWIVHLQKEGIWFCTKPLWFCASHGPYAQRLILGKYHFCSGVNSQPESRKICFHNVGMKCHQPGRCCCMENAWFCSRVDRGNKNTILSLDLWFPTWNDHGLCSNSLPEVIIASEPAELLDNNNSLHLQNAFPLRNAK